MSDYILGKLSNSAMLTSCEYTFVSAFWGEVKTLEQEVLYDYR